MKYLLLISVLLLAGCERPRPSMSDASGVAITACIDDAFYYNSGGSIIYRCVPLENTR